MKIKLTFEDLSQTEAEDILSGVTAMDVWKAKPRKAKKAKMMATPIQRSGRGPTAGYHKTTPKERTFIRDLAKKGYSLREMMERSHRSHATIRRVLRRTHVTEPMPMPEEQK